MKRIVYSSLFIPPEWIVAHGLVPCRIMPEKETGGSNIPANQGVCPFARSFATSAMNDQTAAGMVMTTVCDQMRHVYDFIPRQHRFPSILINIPSTWQGSTSRRMYLSELNRLSRFLCDLGGMQPTDDYLAEVMLRYDTGRSFLRDVSLRLSPRQFTEIAMRFEATGQAHVAIDVDAVASTNDAISVALIGGPRRKEDLAVYKLIEACGGQVDFDATEWGPRSLCRAFNRPRLEDEPLHELADAYFESIPDITRRPNDGFYAWLTPHLHERKIRALIVQRYLWCDLWHAEVERLRSCFELPLLDLDLDGEEPFDSARTRTRIGAFLEMLS
ncbi:2-hydroxyacyl-CoA dehydratase [Planctomycetota bacterium]